MTWLGRTRELNDRADGWLREHVVAWFVLAVTVPGLTLAAFVTVVSGQSAVDGLWQGLLFGVTYAGLTLYWNRE